MTERMAETLFSLFYARYYFLFQCASTGGPPGPGAFCRQHAEDEETDDQKRVSEGEGHGLADELAVHHAVCAGRGEALRP